MLLKKEYTYAVEYAYGKGRRPVHFQRKQNARASSAWLDLLKTRTLLPQGPHDNHLSLREMGHRTVSEATAGTQDGKRGRDNSGKREKVL